MDVCKLRIKIRTVKNTKAWHFSNPTNIITFALFLLFCGMLLIYGGSLAWESISILEHSNSAWGVPLYPAKMMIPLGALFLLLQGIVKLIRDILALSTGKEFKPGDAGERETL